ncbi:MAG: DUF1178 family protein [Rhodospirillales bacterium]|jgi:hypothetical protein|nr:DUF1178 family protein [Rhodospirillales bacterium]
MIKYAVRCANTHEFEGWFKDSATFDVQSKSGDIVCPHCGNTKVMKAPMSPSISKSASTGAASEVRAREVAERILEAAVAMRQEIESKFDYVGEQFADEARRIHYGEADERGIYGEASEDETQELDEEGIDVYRMPTIRRNS